MNTKHTQGFTLIELMVTLTVITVVLTLGVPGYRSMIQNNRMAARANDFLATLNFARSEAVKRGVRVTVCKSADSSSCTTSGDWDQGWIVFTDQGTLSSVDGSDTVLRVYPRLEGSSLTGNTNIANYVSYVATGFSQMTSGAFQAGTFKLCESSTNIPGRAIVINNTGRATVNKATCP